MTTIYEENLRCAVCSTESSHPGISSSSSFGSPDLDTRPPELIRSTMFAWVQRCPGCGYCAADISQAHPETGTLVRAPEYTRRLADAAYPELARTFLCKALVDERRQDYAAAAWALIHAAWVCDDEGRDAQATRCRGHAVDMIRKAVENGQPVAEQEGADVAIQVDLLRRAGRFDEARGLIQGYRPRVTEGLIANILAFQETLIASGDRACHAISEVPGTAE